jgi:hypothetical protein
MNAKLPSSIRHLSFYFPLFLFLLLFPIMSSFLHSLLSSSFSFVRDFSLSLHRSLDIYLSLHTHFVFLPSLIRFLLLSFSLCIPIRLSRLRLCIYFSFSFVFVSLFIYFIIFCCFVFPLHSLCSLTTHEMGTSHPWCSDEMQPFSLSSKRRTALLIWNTPYGCEEWRYSVQANESAEYSLVWKHHETAL